MTDDIASSNKLAKGKGKLPVGDGSTAKPRGFAAMSPERRKEISARGGAAVDPANRFYSKNRDAASKAGRVGGLSGHEKKDG